MAEWKNRIIGNGEEAPDQLLANPHNWRIHPKFQQDALAAVLDEVGWVQEVIVNCTTGHLIDGHLRVQLAMRRDEPTIPVKYVELSEEEEALVLLTLDPISALADKAKGEYALCCELIDTENKDIIDLIESERRHVKDEGDLQIIDYESLPEKTNWILAAIPASKIIDAEMAIEELGKYGRIERSN